MLHKDVGGRAVSDRTPILFIKSDTLKAIRVLCN